DLRDEQQVLDDALQAAGAAPDHAQVRAARRTETLLLVAEHLEEARHRGEWRAQLMRDRRHERVAQAVEVPVGGHLPERPDPANDGSIRSSDRRGVATEDAP